jgi:predicted O-methyltransferase YrrM
MHTTILDTILADALIHRQEHRCGGYPYLHASVLSALVHANNAKQVLELGTGIGYTAGFIATFNPDIHIYTIDQDETHLNLAKMYWEKLQITNQITTYMGKAEGILPTLEGPYDFIFFDGYAPSVKFLTEFSRLLKKGGVLMTANLFVKDPKGGKYLRALNRTRWWHTGVFEDTAVSVKLF